MRRESLMPSVRVEKIKNINMSDYMFDKYAIVKEEIDRINLPKKQKRK